MGSLAADDRKAAVRALRGLAEDRPTALIPFLSTLRPFLVDDERPVRLTTAKLFVAVAEGVPEAVVPFVSTLAERLSDEDEFYYVRARSAEALGYVAIEYPEEVASPGTLADLRIGLAFDEPEVKEKLAKSPEYVALGDPSRLRHQVSNLAEHLDDENDLVRYHLTTALVVVGCEHPDTLADARDALIVRADEDDDPYVRGRAAEAVGLLARGNPDAITNDDLPDAITNDDLPGAEGLEEPFAVDRVRFARGAFAGTDSFWEGPSDIGTVEAVRVTTEDVVRDLTAPDGDGGCPHCGFTLPENGPPMCPRCGAPC